MLRSRVVGVLTWVSSIVLGLNVFLYLSSDRPAASSSWLALVSVCWLWFLARRVLWVVRAVRRAVWWLRRRRGAVQAASVLL